MKKISNFMHIGMALTIALALPPIASMAAGTEQEPNTLLANTGNDPEDGRTSVSVSKPTVATKATNASDRTTLQASTETSQNPPGVLSVSVPAPIREPLGQRKGPMSKIGDDLEAHGITLGLILANSYFANPTTGISAGKAVDYFALFMSADVNLTKLLGIPNTHFHITEAWEPPSHNTRAYAFQAGSAFTPFPVQTTSSDLVKFTLSHDLFEKRLHIEYGRMNLADDFMLSTMCTGCLPSTPAITLNVPGFAKSVWGTRIAYQLSHHTRLGFGLIEDNTALFTNSSGWDWSSRTRTGVISVANIVYATDFSDTPYPLNAEAGIYHSTSPYTDDFHNVDGSSQALNPNQAALTHGSGTSGLYGQARKVVWIATGSYGPVRPNMALYGGAFITPGVGQSYPIEAYGGTEFGGFLKNNPAALIGSTVRYIRLSKGRALYEQQLSTINGWGSSRVHQDTFAFDVHAQYGLAPGLLINGSVQYFLHPNRTHTLAAVGPSRSGFMVGVNVFIDIGRLSGLAKR
ncbi:porin [Robbsia andropogonis]|uniref:Porin n=1 Tax=Robbsia andropogonis TaxID=28092 RepID=A0A0F5JTK2_9BURK|nr:carbohydrate porin [Robbsia andropogonis]KKB60984.1 porin [Robbsia andropogonis]MCP1121648.1 carbohydrate porin [Robbsia andropogonis]MCP1131462.1 carbohydrate porin [Robbsia andropogonis]